MTSPTSCLIFVKRSQKLWVNITYLMFTLLQITPHILFLYFLQITMVYRTLRSWLTSITSTCRHSLSCSLKHTTQWSWQIVSCLSYLTWRRSQLSISKHSLHTRKQPRTLQSSSPLCTVSCLLPSSPLCDLDQSIGTRTSHRLGVWLSPGSWPQTLCCQIGCWQEWEVYFGVVCSQKYHSAKRTTPIIPNNFIF